MKRGSRIGILTAAIVDLANLSPAVPQTPFIDQSHRVGDRGGFRHIPRRRA